MPTLCKGRKGWATRVSKSKLSYSLECPPFAKGAKDGPPRSFCGGGHHALLCGKYRVGDVGAFAREGFVFFGWKYFVRSEEQDVRVITLHPVITVVQSGNSVQEFR